MGRRAEEGFRPGRRPGAAALALALALVVVRGDGWGQGPEPDGPVRSFDVGRFFGARSGRTQRTTPVGTLRLPPGFRAELLYTVPYRQQGSWVCLATDPKGRLIASAQAGGLYRITPPPIGAPASETLVEPIDPGQDIGGAQGLLCAFDSLYVVANARGRSALYRLRDTDGDDRYDRVDRLRGFAGDGEHGPHAVVLGPGGRDLYLIGGNNSFPSPPPETSPIAAEWRVDRLQRRIGGSDGRFGRDRPGGWIVRTDPEGRSSELVAMGFRNPYDLAVSPDGELFTYDSDMEWDAGTPWYRPTRINHVIHGADFGWRAGTSKWPDDYVDGFGSVVDVGFGSPTGLTFGTGSTFPAPYRHALFIADWSYGNIYAVHMEPRGASYAGTVERFVSGAPLPVTDLVIRPQDGALYFTVGGRGTGSALYRVTYAGEEPTRGPDPSPVDRGAGLRALRHRLEGVATLEDAWANLGHQDRAIRHAARLAVERHPVERWRSRATTEPDPRARIAALVALARRSDGTDRTEIVEALGRLDWAGLSDADRLDLLRAYELAALRPTPADAATRERILRALDPRFPTQRARLDRELAEILSALDAPGVIPRLLGRLEESRTQEQQIHYLMCLHDVRSGWTSDLRRRVLGWLDRAGSQGGGFDVGDSLDRIRRDLIEPLSQAEKEALGDLIREHRPEDPSAGLKARPSVRKWTVEDLLPLVERPARPPDRDRGRQVFSTALCYRCHRFEGQGGMVGPDLTGLAGRFGTRELLEAVLEPSRVVSDQYQTSRIAMKDGRVLSGRIKDINGDTMLLMTDPLKPADLLMISGDAVEEIAWSGSSMMPEGLLDTFVAEEIVDLLAFLRPTAAEK